MYGVILFTFLVTVPFSLGDLPKLKVVSILTPPYLSKGADGKYSGFIPEVLDLIAPIAGFKYDLFEQPDKEYGTNRTGWWNGVVGTLVNKSADIAAIDLTINADRLGVIDFTIPYFVSQIRILSNRKFHLKDVKYLMVKSRMYQAYFSTAVDPFAKQIWKSIQENDGIVNNTDEGVKRVLSGPFALVRDSKMLEPYLNEHPLELEAPTLFENTFTAFGLQLGSSWRQPISIALAKINEGGLLTPLLNKYSIS